MGFEGPNDVIGTDVDVMVAENAEALRSLEGGEDLGGYAGGRARRPQSESGPRLTKSPVIRTRSGAMALTWATICSRK